MDENAVQAIVDELEREGPWFWETKSPGSGERLSALKQSRLLFQRALGAAKGSPEEVVQVMLTRNALESRYAAMHAMAATDLSAEMLDRVRQYARATGVPGLTISIPPRLPETVTFRFLHQCEGKLGRQRIEKKNAVDIHHDVLLIALYGGCCAELNFPTFERCVLGGLAGHPEKVLDFFAELYLAISSQVRGGGAVSSGSAMQKGVLTNLEKELRARGVDYERTPGNRFPAHVGEGMQFDSVFKIGTPPRSYVSVEVAFQETTNSVIERKAKQAEGSRVLMGSQGFKSCYVVAGAGWYSRRTALKRLIRNSDLCVSPKQVGKLADYIASL